MKKIISLIATVAMMSTMLVSNASAAVDTNLPATDGTVKIVTSKPVKIDSQTYVDDVEEDVPEGYSVYEVSVGLESTGGLSRTSSKNVTGKLLSNFTYVLDFAGTENMQKTPALSYYETGLGYANFSSNKWDGDSYKVVMNATYPTTKTDIEDSNLTRLAVLYFVVKDGTQVTATVSDETLIGIGNYTSGSTTNNTKYKIGENSLTATPASFTIGEAAGYKFTEGAKKDITTDDGINGIVWDGNKMVGFDLVNKSYVAKFTANGAEPKTRALSNLTAATVESDGSIEFDAILRFKDNANPKKAADVTFTVVEE